jgi:signal transduction histidine kinase
VNTLINAMPEWMRSARFRLTLLYSSILFVVAAVLAGTLYFALYRSISSEPVWRQVGVATDPQSGVSRRVFRTDMRGFERIVNGRTLKELKQYSFGALGVLFIVSLGIGWVVSGRVLSPIDRITEVARRIQATDLSQRIGLEGPDDELKRLADTFDGMLERLDDAFRSQRRFVSDASHELRNPLATIRTNLDVVMADENATEADLRQTIVVARRATDRMGTLVDDLLALARLETPRPQWETVSITTLIGEVVEEFAGVAVDKHITLEPTVAIGLHAHGDPETLKRAAANLLDNALSFAPEDSQVRVGAGRNEDWIWIAVEDEGPGIPTNQQRRIFDRLWRADKSRSRGRGGSGLGLAIVRQVAEAHNGDVRVFSKPGSGSTFVLWIPVHPGNQATLPPDDLPLARASFV